MSIHVALRVLGWLPVVWLVTVHLLIERGRLPRGGWAFRIAASLAAASVLVASLDTGMWPVAALGLLWLRTEVFVRPVEEKAAKKHAEPIHTEPPYTEPHHTEPHYTDQPHRTRVAPDWAPRPSRSGTTTTEPKEKAQQPHQTHPAHHPRPRSTFTAGLFRYGPPAMAWLFKIEIVVVLIVGLILFGSWSAHQRIGFNHRADTTLCGLMGGC